LQDFGETAQIASATKKSEEQDDDDANRTSADTERSHAWPVAPASPTAIDHLAGATGFSFELDHVANLPRTGRAQPLQRLNSVSVLSPIPV
jgi:hypothetical protein